MYYLKSLVYFCLFCFISSATQPLEEETELILVHVILRHGARTTYQFYPNDPYKNMTFYPTGLGGLTNEGKLQEYNLGRVLRHHYGQFIGEHYVEEEVYARASEVTRTIMSAQLALAGLFPPSKNQTWNEDLMWQPIPVRFKPDALEDLFHPWSSCPYKVYVLSAVLPQLQQVQDRFIKPYQELFDYIRTYSGQNVSNPSEMQDFYFILETEEDSGLTLPEWTRNIYPEPAQSVAAQVYGYHNFDSRIKQINIGFMLRKILNDTMIKIQGQSKRKLYLYSGHESTLGYMLNALEVYRPQVPPYASAIIFEVRKGHNQHYIKLRYRNNTNSAELVDLSIPGCDVLCPFEQFVYLKRELIPNITVEAACSRSSS